MADRLIDPRADARDARFLEFYLSGAAPGSIAQMKPVWDVAWQAAVDWLQKDGGR